jgi:hypothetical protein
VHPQVDVILGRYGNISRDRYNLVLWQHYFACFVVERSRLLKLERLWRVRKIQMILRWLVGGSKFVDDLAAARSHANTLAHVLVCVVFLDKACVLFHQRTVRRFFTIIWKMVWVVVRSASLAVLNKLIVMRKHAARLAIVAGRLR